MIPYLHLASSQGVPHHLVVVAWTEGEAFTESPVVVVEVSGTLGFFLLVGSSRLYIPPVPLRMFGVVVWSIIFLLQVMSLVDGI